MYIIFHSLALPGPWIGLHSLMGLFKFEIQNGSNFMSQCTYNFSCWVTYITDTKVRVDSQTKLFIGGQTLMIH